MVCEGREGDPSKEIEFVLMCPECKYWLCHDCREQLPKVGKYSCLNCDTKIIPQIVEYEPQSPKQEPYQGRIDNIEDIFKETYQGAYAAGDYAQRYVIPMPKLEQLKMPKMPEISPVLDEPGSDWARNILSRAKRGAQRIANPETAEKWWKKAQAKMKQDPHFVPLVRASAKEAQLVPSDNDNDIHGFDRSAGEGEGYIDDNSRTLKNFDFDLVDDMVAGWKKKPKKKGVD